MLTASEIDNSESNFLIRTFCLDEHDWIHTPRLIVPGAVGKDYGDIGERVRFGRVCFDENQKADLFELTTVAI